jgi:hypothetical protein
VENPGANYLSLIRVKLLFHCQVVVAGVATEAGTGFCTAVTVVCGGAVCDLPVFSLCRKPIARISTSKMNKVNLSLFIKIGSGIKVNPKRRLVFFISYARVEASFIDLFVVILSWEPTFYE